VLSPNEIEQILASHRLYLKTEYHEGHRANFSSADLTRRNFSGLNLRGTKMDRAVLRGADFTGANLQSANLAGNRRARRDLMFFIFFHFAPSNARVREGALGMTTRIQFVLN
jgi:hypothetical protein